MTLRKLLLVFLAVCLAASLAAAQQPPELYVRTNHADVIKAVAVSPNGKLAASGSSDGTVRLWDVQNGNVIRTLSGHSGIVFSLLFVSDSELLSGSAREIRSWELKTGKLLREVPTHRSVTSMALSPDQKILAYAAIDRVMLLDKSAGKPRELTVPGKSPSHVAFRPSATGDPMLAASFDNVVVLWNAKTGEQLGVAEHMATADVRSIAFSPDGKMLATCGTDYWYIWNVETKNSMYRGGAVGHGVAFSPDSKTIAIAGNDIEFWNLETGKRNKVLEIKNNLISSIAYSPDGKLLIGGGYQSIPQTNGLEASFKMWDTKSYEERPINAVYTTSLASIALSPDGRILASGSGDKKIRLWNLASGQVDRPLGDMESTVVDLAFSADNQLLASTGLQDRVRFWDMTTRSEFVPGETGKKKTEPAQSSAKKKPAPAASPSPSSSNNPFDQLISAMDMVADKASRTNWGTPVFSSDGKKFATLEKGYRIALRDVKTWEALHTLTGHQSEVYTVAFSRDGKLVASGSDDGLTKIWDTSTGTEVRTLSKHRMSVRSLAFSPDGAIIASGSNDGTIRLWDVATGALLRILSGYGNYVRSVVFSPDGKKLINGGMTDHANVWDVASGRLLRTLTGHATDVLVVLYSADGKFLFTCSRDASTKVWRESDGAEMATLILLGDGDWLVVTPDGLFDGSPAAWRQIVWRFGDTFNTAPVEAFFADFFYPGLLADILAGKEPKAASKLAQKDIRQPQITLTEMEAIPKRSAGPAREIQVRIEVAEAPADATHPAGSGAQDVRLFRNGSLVRVFRGDVLKGKSSATIETTLPITAGENQLTAYAFNRDNIKSADATLVVTGAEGLRRKGTLYLLAIGVNAYANQQYNLKFAVADANEFAAELRRQQQRMQAYDRVEIISLKDREATKANITAQLARLSSLAQPEDGVVVYFAGHGTAQQNQFFLIPHDLGYRGDRTALTKDGLQSILAHSISDRDLEQAFTLIDAGQLLLVIDACNSGQALEAEEKRRGPMNSKGLAQLAYEKGMYILTAAQSYQAAMEASRLGHGYLTYALVEEGLRKGAADKDPKDGNVAVREWLDYATDRVPQMQEENLQGRIVMQDNVSFVEGEEKIADPKKRSVQRPRVFYRRELDAQPLVIARTPPAPVASPAPK
jgi:WD40 repeat protein